MSTTEKKQVLLGTRIPSDLKLRLSKYCVSHGVKISYFVTQAIKEKLQDLVEDRLDIAEAEKRLQKPEFISREEFEKYLHKRGIKY